jgi:hypothetical protein
MVTVLITQLVLIRNVFYLCENAQNSHNFCSISVLFFFSLKDNIRGHHPMIIFFSCLCPLKYNSGCNTDNFGRTLSLHGIHCYTAGVIVC